MKESINLKIPEDTSTEIIQTETKGEIKKRSTHYCGILSNGLTHI